MITSWGVGTNLITAKDNPAFGGVYKLAAIRQEDGTFLPKIKLSENTEKVTNPGNKIIYRIYDNDTGKIRADYICLEGESFDTEEDLILFDPNEPWKKNKTRRRQLYHAKASGSGVSRLKLCLYLSFRYGNSGDLQ